MSELLEVDGISFRGQGFGASTRTGRYGLPNRRGENLVLPGASGTSFVANKPFEEGVGALSVWAIGATTAGDGSLQIPSTFAGQRAAFEENMATVMRLFTRPHRLSTIRAAQPDGSVRRALVEWREWSEPEIQAGGTRAEWAIAYTIPSVWWEDESVTTQSAVAGAVIPKNLNATLFTGMTGVIDDAVITVTGPIVNPVVTDAETGNYVKYSGSVGSGQTWVVDVAAATSTLNGSSVIQATTHTGGYKLFSVPNCNGTLNYPQLVLTGLSAASGTNVRLDARRKWVNG